MDRQHRGRGSKQRPIIEDGLYYWAGDGWYWMDKQGNLSQRFPTAEVAKANRDIIQVGAPGRAVSLQN